MDHIYSLEANSRSAGPENIVQLESNNNNIYLVHETECFFEKLTVLQLVKIFHLFYGTRRFITAFTSARQLSLS
jgi:hypothetical protein